MQLVGLPGQVVLLPCGAHAAVQHVCPAPQVVGYDLLVGADGCNSLVRSALAETLPHGFCTHIKVPASAGLRAALSRRAQGGGRVQGCQVYSSALISVDSHSSERAESVCHQERHGFPVRRWAPRAPAQDVLLPSS